MIEVNNLTTAKIDEKFLKKIAQKVLDKEISLTKASDKKKKKEFDLSIALVGQDIIRNLNHKYRRKDGPTDVLSFTYNKNSGEIVVCPGEIKKNAEKFGESFRKELTLILIHGVLHLFGYDHEKNKIDASKMEKKEKFYLKIYG